MKTSLSSCLIVLVLSISSCSKPVCENNAATPNVNNAGTPEKKLPSKSEDVVLSDGQNSTKKSGWRVPTTNKRKIEETSVNLMPTEEGKEVEVTHTHYSFEIPWSYTEDFLDLRGPLKLESHFIMEHSIKGKVFMYTIFAKETRVTPPSNSEPHEDTFVYLIQDMDGDGIFETLIHGEDVIVPKWVLK
jgi:hypothetical protein